MSENFHPSVASTPMMEAVNTRHHPNERDGLVSRAQHGDRACSTWCRRPREWPISLDDTILINHLSGQGLQPSEVIFQRLRDEELRSTLRSIPETNRIALLMSVWSESSYKQIAEFTGVPISTVEGRIHRAKSQLQRRLRHGFSDPFGDPVRRWIEPIDKETPK